MQPAIIGRSELQAALATQTPPVLLEALDEAYYKKGHLPGAIALPLGQLDAVVQERAWTKATPLVVYCASSACPNSDVAAKALVALGYQNVRVYGAGKADWIDGGLPVEV